MEAEARTRGIETAWKRRRTRTIHIVVVGASAQGYRDNERRRICAVGRRHGDDGIDDGRGTRVFERCCFELSRSHVTICVTCTHTYCTCLARAGRTARARKGQVVIEPAIRVISSQPFYRALYAHRYTFDATGRDVQAALMSDRAFWAKVRPRPTREPKTHTRLTPSTSFVIRFETWRKKGVGKSNPASGERSPTLERRTHSPPS